MQSSQLSRFAAQERLLCLSNGHGEDVIALRILQALQPQPHAPRLAALPLVGEGHAYTRAGIDIIGTVKAMPSGGFVYMDGRQLARDIQGGLLQLALAQVRTIRNWAKQGGSILAVGDIVPLLLAWMSGVPFAFVGTAKSDYYLRDTNGQWLPDSFWERWSQSIYFPWERWLMQHRRCLAVFPRDSLTTKILQRWPIPAYDLGNPMMDGLEPQVEPQGSYQGPSDPSSPLILLLLPGSRPPEAYDNWQQILAAVASVTQLFAPQPLVFLAAIAPSLNLSPLQSHLSNHEWQPLANVPTALLPRFPDSGAQYWTRQNATLVLSQQAFADCLHRSAAAIAMAGTATEQTVGLGKPVITLPGRGPQFTLAFAQAQTRLLGNSVQLVSTPSQVAPTLRSLLNQPAQLHQIATNGQQRMGSPGAAQRIADCLMERLAQTSFHR